MTDKETGPWDEALGLLREWDGPWAAACDAVATNSWRSGVLSRKLVELISLAINVACTNLNADGTRRHIRKALDAGASRDEILFVFKCASVMAIHSCSLAAPILLEEAKAAGAQPKPSAPVATPACDKMKALGQWNEAWNPFLSLDPAWTDALMATGAGIYASGVLPPKDTELLSIAFDASFTHMYAPGTRRHIHNALKAGASMEEIFEVLKLCVAQGVQAINLGAPILAEELLARANREASDASQHKPFLSIPETVSSEAQEFLRKLTDPALSPPFPEPSDLAGWKKFQDLVEADALPKARPLVEHYAPIIRERLIGGVPVQDVSPQGWSEGGRFAVYVHGGAHTLYSAKSMLGRAAVFAHDTGLRTIAVDYTLAPHAKFQAITDEVIAAIGGLVDEGRSLKDLIIYGDSSGGGLAASVILKMRDRGMGLPAVAILVSPWSDLTPAGDTETTLKHAEANYLYERHSVKAAGAYAEPADQKHPYASPVYGDFTEGFPPTLIQGGTKEILLSGFVRLYQALDVAGQEVKLDIYEGMPHNFASRIPDAPESIVARRKIAAFIEAHIG